MRDKLPQLVNTPELRFDCPDDRKFKVVEEVKARLKQAGAKVNDIDGVRVNTPDGWWLLRASNTQAVLVARCESANEAGLERLMGDLKAALAASGVELPDEASAATTDAVLLLRHAARPRRHRPGAGPPPAAAGLRAGGAAGPCPAAREGRELPDRRCAIRKSEVQGRHRRRPERPRRRAARAPTRGRAIASRRSRCGSTGR